MNKKWIKITAGAITALIILLVGVRIVFNDKFENFNKYIEARDTYKGDKKEFDKNFENMNTFIEDCKAKNPGATDREVQEAFNKALSGK